MANINKIKLSGTSYDIQDSNAARSITLTQAEYDALQNKDPNVFYIISDSTLNYVTSAETESAITQAVSGKADTSAVTSVSDSLTAHTANTTVHVTAQDKTNWNNKSDFSGSYNDLTNKPTIPTVPTNVSDFTNDAGYITSDDISGKTNQSDFTAHTANTTVHVTANEKSSWNAKSDFSGNYNDLSNKPTIPSKTSDLTNDSNFATTGDVQTATNDMATKTWVGQQGYLTQHQDISGKQDVSGMTAYTETSAFTAHTADTTIHVTSVEKATWNAKSDFSGDYNDLTNKPTIPTVPTNVSDFTNDAGYITIDAISGKVDTDDFNTYSGSVESRLSEDEEVTAAALNTLNNAVSGKADANNVYTKAQTNTLLGGKQDTLVSSSNIKTINNESILGSGNITIQGGSTYTAGRGISIANDTISFSLPISAGTGANSIVEGNTNTKARGSYSHAEGNNTTASGNMSHAEGMSTMASGNMSHAEGVSTTASGGCSHAEGYYAVANNQSEHASGQYNVSNKASTTFGDSGNTLFSVGNGSNLSNRHNAFEIRQNGDIYLTKDGQDVKLQDQLGSITVDSALSSTSENPVQNKTIYNKINEVEQVTAAGLNALNDAFGGLKLVKLTQTEYDNLSTKDSNTLYVING